MSRFNISNQQINNVVGNYISPKLNKVYSNAEVNVAGSCNGDYLHWNTTSNSWTVGSNEVSIGCGAGEFNQGTNAVALGYQAGNNNQGTYAIAIGALAGQNYQSYQTVAIGYQAGLATQGIGCVAIGTNAGQTNQGFVATAVGSAAGQNNQGSNAVAVGRESGQNFQGENSIAIGFQAGENTQGSNAIAIGYQAGRTNQGTYAIAIGALAGATNQSQNSIILNASGSVLTTSNSGFYVNPVRTASSTGALMIYDSTNKEITISSDNTSATNKTFVIDHPLDSEKYLVHACLEGPEAGVYYRGEAEITNGKDVVVELPEYVDKFSNEFTVQLTQISILESDDDDQKESQIFTHLAYSKIKNNKFKVYSSNGNVKFSWHVYGKRQNIQVEPSKKDVELKGDGPYKYLSLIQ